MSYTRFAIYYLPRDGALATFGATWLGWDVASGSDAVQLDEPGLSAITTAPRKYGFHGTLKPPFRLNETTELSELTQAVSDLAASLAPARCDALSLTALGGFLALRPDGDAPQLRRVADACVRDLDRFRASASEAELARRRKAGLTERQEAMLATWGYPYVMDEFRFHMTLSGRLSAEERAHWSGVLERVLPDLPAPFTLDQIALCGEREDGKFELIHRYTLAG